MYPLGFLLGKTPEAKQYYLRASENGVGGAANNVGILLLNEGNLTEAEAQLRTAVEKGDKNARATLAVVLLKQNRAQDALGVLEGNASTPAAKNTLACVYFTLKLKSPEELRSLVKSAADDGDIAAVRNLGILYALAGDNKEASVYLEKAYASGCADTILPLAIVTANADKKLSLLQGATKEKVAGAAVRYGIALEGKGLYSEALEVYKTNANADPECKLHEAYLLETAPTGVASNVPNAMKLYREVTTAATVTLEIAAFAKSRLNSVL